jgi:hypothetical protein
MATTLTSTTFLSDYNDDYRDSDHYHRILFNNGRALQARELTQSQSIIQAELGRIASFIVNEGAIFNNSGNMASGANAFAFTYLKLNSLPVGYAALRGTEITDGDLTAIVKAVIPAADGDPDTLLVKMTYGQVSGSIPDANTTVPKQFAAGATITTDLGNVTIQSTSDAIGRGSLVEMPQFDTFASGHLIQVDAQTLVINKYDAFPTDTIGFKVVEQIITTVDNIALYDNSGATPNLTSPGADRLKITLILSKGSEITDAETFFEIYKVVDGRVQLTRTDDKILSQIGDLISERTNAVNGDFIERRTDGMYDLSVLNDSIDDNFLELRISSGTAFIGGRKISNDYNLPIRFRKPRNLITDVTTQTNEFLSARYGNYFLCDSAFGLIGHMTDLDSVGLYSSLNIANGYKVGSARIRHIDEYNNNYRVHVFDVNTTTSFVDIRSIGTDSANYANLTTVQGKFDLFDRTENNLFFELPRNRVQEISSVTMAVGKIYTDVTSGGGVAQISTGSSNTFADEEQWIVSVDANGMLYTEVSVTSGGAGSTVADISGLPNTAAVSVLAYENVTASLKTKTLKPSTTTWQSESVSLVGGVFTLSKADIYEYNRVIDNATNENITRKFKFDNGQRDNYYGPGKGTLKNGVLAPTGTVTVEYRYFQHSTPLGVGYFGGKASYPDVQYEDTPTFTSVTGKSYQLVDVIDMRPLKNPATETFSGGISRIEPIPRNGDTITIGVVKYWNPRIDVISMDRTGSLVHHEGVSSLLPNRPNNIPMENLRLHEIEINPYTLNKNDLTVITYNNDGYKMSDIRRLDKRINTLERLATLTQTESSLAQLQVFDPDTGTTLRQTQGLSGDGFNNPYQSNIVDPDYRAKPGRGLLQPTYFMRSLGFTYDSDLSENTVLKGSTVWPTYTEVVYINQSKATQAEQVNRYEIAQSIGVGFLSPQTDIWSIRKLVDKSYTAPSNSSLNPESLIEISSQSINTNIDEGKI